MEFWIAFILILIVGLIINYGKKHNQKTKPNKASVAEKTKAEAEHQRKLQESDELITVILPTINDK